MAEKRTSATRATYTRAEGDRPATVREVVALRRELEALRERVESLTGLVAKRLGVEAE